MLDVVMMIGFDRVILGGSIASPDSSSGDVPVDEPLDGGALERCKAVDDFDAIFANAVARLGWCIRVVRSDRRDVILGFESTLWNSCLSLARGSALSDTESSQSDPSSSSSSSSSIALSRASSSSSDSKTSSSSCDFWLMIRDSTSSLKEVCFLFFRGSFSPAVNELCLVAWDDICSSNELSSSSPDEPPRRNMPPIFDPSAFE